MEMNFIKIRQFADKMAFRERAGANMQGLRVRRTELKPYMVLSNNMKMEIS
jgi:hypothetical protein